MIITVTLNPAIDRIVTVRDFRYGGLNRVVRSERFSGGKGNNVALIVHRLGFPCTATGFLSGHPGRELEKDLADEGLCCVFVYTPGETRTNTKIIDENTRVCTELNESGPQVSISDIERLEQILSQITKEGDTVVFSGSVPYGLPEDIYARLIRIVRRAGARTILDADGPFLREGIRANPDAIKPNIDELSRLVGRTVMTPEEIVAAVRELRPDEERKVLVSMGSGGSMFFSGDEIRIMDAPSVPVVSTVGAGDAMTAALAIGLSEGRNDEEIFENAGAFSAVTVMSEHFERMDTETISEARKMIRIRRFGST